MTDFFGYSRLRSLAFHQPFGSLMLHGKIETRRVQYGKRPPFPAGEYLFYTTKEPASLSVMEKYCDQAMQERIQRTLAEEPTACLHGYAIALGTLVNIRRMRPEDSNKCFIDFNNDPARSGQTTWCLFFENIRRIKPFEWQYGQQGIGFVPAKEYARIQVQETNPIIK
jgi:hypothetical protein